MGDSVGGTVGGAIRDAVAGVVVEADSRRVRRQ
jgi:hypothetical protein